MTNRPAFIRSLGLLDATLLVVGCIVGSGIFRTASMIGAHVHSATLTLAPDSALVVLDQSAGPVAPLLQLVHPIESTLDRQLVLAPDPGGWRAGESIAAPHGWHVRLLAADGSWRLVGRYQPGDTTVELAPSVGAP